MRDSTGQTIGVRATCPLLVFQVTPEAGGTTLWYEVGPSGTGVYVTVHREKPTFDHDGFSERAGMASVRIEHWPDPPFPDTPQRDRVQVQLWDERRESTGRSASLS